MLNSHSLHYLITILISCSLVWGWTTFNGVVQAEKRLKTATNAAYLSGAVVGYNDAMQFVADRCKDNITWSWQGDPASTTYICRKVGFTGQSIVDTDEWIPYIVLDDML